MKIIEDGIYIPEIKNPLPNYWNLYNITARTKAVTYINKESITSCQVFSFRPHDRISAYAAALSTDSKKTFAGYLYDLETFNYNPIMSMNHVIWIIENRPDMLNTTEKNAKNQYIGNFFFIQKNEIENNIWTGQHVVASVMRRNSIPNLEFGIKFYSINDKRIWEAKDRRIISLS